MRRLVFVTNYLSIHTFPICDLFYQLMGEDFLVLEKQDADLYREKMGWSNIKRSYTKKYDGNQMEYVNSQYAICSSMLDSYTQMRIDNGKLTFLCAERPYKIPTDKKNYFRRYIGAYLHFGRYQSPFLYYLAIGAYAKEDMLKFHNFENKCLKWGYFPRIIQYEEKDLLQNRTNCSMWVGRMISWKHPEIFLNLCNEVYIGQHSYHAKMIGDGPLKSSLKHMIDIYSLPVELYDFQSNDFIRKQMFNSDTYICTSDRQEGWGVVMNEAMNAGCVLFANQEAGATNYLIHDGENGYIYKSEEELKSKLLNYMQLKDEDKNKLRLSACSTVSGLWSANIAANRFLTLIQQYERTGKICYFNEGPLSKA